MDLNNKAKWHMDLNGGTIPILEMPSGEIIVESKVIMDFAHEYGKDAGL
jgi:glutathione S-transferase